MSLSEAAERNIMQNLTILATATQKATAATEALVAATQEAAIATLAAAMISSFGRRVEISELPGIINEVRIVWRQARG